MTNQMHFQVQIHFYRKTFLSMKTKTNQFKKKKKAVELGFLFNNYSNKELSRKMTVKLANSLFNEGKTMKKNF